MKPALSAAIFLTAVSLTLGTGCAPLASCLEDMSCKGHGDDDDSTDDATRADQASQALTCVTGGRPHIGLGGEDLAAKEDGPPGGDRARVKPFSALVTEYPRVLGRAPASLKTAGSTFGVPQERWFLEPIASGVYLSRAFEVAFEGCAELVAGDPRFEVAPTPGTAHDACTEWTRRFWSRDATPEQLEACTAAATEAAVDPWAYACASVLTATGFLTF